MVSISYQQQKEVLYGQIARIVWLFLTKEQKKLQQNGFGELPRVQSGLFGKLVQPATAAYFGGEKAAGLSR